MTQQISPPGFGMFAPLMRNSEGIQFIIWWLSDYETAQSYVRAFIDKGMFEYGQAVEVFRPGMFQ